MPEKLSNSRITWMAHCASIAEMLCSSLCLWPWKNTQTAVRCPSLPHRNENPLCPASTTFPAVPLWRPLLNRGGDKVSLQLIRHFLVATTVCDWEFGLRGRRSRLPLALSNLGERYM